MSDFERGYARSIPHTGDMSVDAGLRAFMLGVYNKMALGLLLSAVLAFGVANFPPMRDLLYATTASGAFAGYTILGLVLSFAPLVLLLVAGFVMKNPSPAAAAGLYWTIVSVIGVSGAVWVLRYNLPSLASTFLITATAFGALSLFGYTTKKNLSGMGSFLIMGVWGLIAAGLATFLLPGLGSNPIFFFGFNIIGVLIFAGLTAYDTQRLKMTYYEMGGDQNGLAVATNYGALSLYLDFINMFQFLLALFGGRRE
ncbi:BAX inhibitor (BI)-1/YccA family protein [Caulobacter sp. SLTY]|uniref:Bax inhibitor-1/YccA family protein n=1 Tax=Caulobacter sp. SLTY TaxID=2683262 RepID=UPI001413282D|nr:Bax inhibitor-1/YccA family protein [Caulobacter sp. SLTY]NBB14112.1 BAX inhibitor (BI)-1/YccA family protein [Caulobacter sp. SLTY]